MRISRIELKNFKCWKDLQIEFKRPVNFIFGPNASGKSSIAQAISLALTGTLDRKVYQPKDAYRFSSHGANKFRIGLELDGYRHEFRSEEPKPLYARLGMDREVLTALMNTGNFLDLHPNDQKKLLFDLLGLKVTGRKIRELTRAWLQKSIELEAETEGVLSLLPDLPETAGIEEAYQEAYDERRITKRELQRFGAITEPPDHPEKVEARIRENRQKLKELREELGRLKGFEAGSRQARLEDAQKELQRIEERLASIEAEGLPQHKAKQELMREIEKLESEIRDNEAELSKLNARRSDLQRALETLLATEDVRKRLRERISKLLTEGKCPFFPAIPCKTKAAIEKAKELAPRGESERAGALKQEIEHLDSEISEVRAKISELREKERDLLARSRALDQKREALEELTRKKAELERKVAELSGAQEACDREKLSQLQRKIQDLETELEVDGKILEAVELWKEKLRLQEKVRRLEVLCQALSPKGIVADLLSQALTRVNELTQRLMTDLTDGEYSLSLDPDFRIRLERKGYGVLTLPSASERFRAGIVIQAALSELSGLRLMVIDGLDILDQQNKGFFFRFVNQIKDRFDTILVFCTTGQNPPKDPGLPDIEFFTINGTVKSLQELRMAA